MAKPAYIEVNGKRYPWRDLVELRRQQLAAEAKAVQPPLFDLREDRKPATEATATLRYLEPTLLALLDAPKPENDGDSGQGRGGTRLHNPQPRPVVPWSLVPRFVDSGAENTSLPVESGGTY